VRTARRAASGGGILIAGLLQGDIENASTAFPACWICRSWARCSARPRSSATRRTGDLVNVAGQAGRSRHAGHADRRFAPSRPRPLLPWQMQSLRQRPRGNQPRARI
jgi:hypothetical protein